MPPPFLFITIINRVIDRDGLLYLILQIKDTYLVCGICHQNVESVRKLEISRHRMSGATVAEPGSEVQASDVGLIGH